MAGEIQLNNVTLATESGGVITLNNGTLGSSVVFPAGHILRTFYNESDAAIETITTTGSTYSELDISVPSGASVSDYILIILATNGIYNRSVNGAFLQIGLKYSTNDWATATTLGTAEFYDRPGYLGSANGLVVQSCITVRVNHPTTSAYRIRPWYKAQADLMNINQTPDSGTGTLSTMTVFEIKG